MFLIMSAPVMPSNSFRGSQGCSKANGTGSLSGTERDWQPLSNMRLVIAAKYNLLSIDSLINNIKTFRIYAHTFVYRSVNKFSNYISNNRGLLLPNLILSF